jgi:hypothetical protein
MAAAAARMELGILGFDSALLGLNKRTFLFAIVSPCKYSDIVSNITFDDNVPMSVHKHYTGAYD